MLEQLQEALAKYQEQEDTIQNLQIKLLEKSVELGEAKSSIEKLREGAIVNQKLETAASKAMALANVNAKLLYKLEQAELKASQLNKELQGLKGTDNPKKLREQNHRLKEKNKELQKGNEMLKTQNKQYRTEAKAYQEEIKSLFISRSQMTLTHCYSDNGHELWLIPSKLGMYRGSRKEHVMAMLHLAPNGIGYLVTIMDGEISLDESVKAKDLPSMPQGMYEHAETWLSKVEAQSYNVTDSDLLAIGGFKNLAE